VTVKTYA